MEPHSGDDKPHQSPPTLWPVGFAVGVAALLVGLVVSWAAVAAGAAIALVFGFLWVRDLTRGYREEPVELEPERRAEAPAREREPAEPAPAERFPRNVFLEGATLGVGGLIGAAVAVPALGFAVLPPFIRQKRKEVDVGPVSDFPEGQFVITTFLSDPAAGEVSRRTAYIRNNGLLNGQPSFTVVSNRCVHLGCPVQPNGPIFDKQKKTVKGAAGTEVDLIPTKPAGYGCPCHGGQYDIEGNRTAGPPVRALDRYEFSIRNGRLILGQTFSVSHVVGEGKNARISKFTLTGPGQHVTGAEGWLYPFQPPH